MTLDAILDRWPDLWDRLRDVVTVDRAAEVFTRLADTPAPSQIARHTRGRVLADLLAEAPAHVRASLALEPNLAGSGCTALRLGRAARKPVWWLTHLDAISYAIRRREGRLYSLTPLCAHHGRSGRRPALALRHVPPAAPEVVARGDIISERGGKAVFFEADVEGLAAGVRVVYESHAQVDRASGRLVGNIDNAFACAAAFLAAVTLGSLSNRQGAPAEVLAAFPDEEEGVVGDGNQTFGRGSLRLFHRTPIEHLPDLVIVSDVQEAGDTPAGDGGGAPRIGRGATCSEVSSLGRGGIVPPGLVGFHRDLIEELAPMGILLQENAAGYVSRSDEVSAVLFSPNVAVIGYFGTDRHFGEHEPTADVRDLVHLASTLVVYTLVAQDEAWRAAYLG